MTASRRLDNLRRLKTDLPLYAAECLKVKAKSGKLVPLIFNRPQLYLHQQLEAQRKRLARDKPGLGHGPFYRINKQEYAIHHRQDSLHFATKIRVARCVNDVDVRPFVIDGAILGQDRDPTLALKVVRIHDTFCDGLMSGEGPRLLQQLVDQLGLAMVNVSNDGNVADVAFFARHG